MNNCKTEIKKINLKNRKHRIIPFDKSKRHFVLG